MVQDVLADDAIVRKLDPHVIVLSLALDELDPAYGTPGWRADVARSELENLFSLVDTNTRHHRRQHLHSAHPFRARDRIVRGWVRYRSQVNALNTFIANLPGNAPRFCLVD